MRNKKTKIFLVLVIVIIIVILRDTFTQTGVSDLKGGFTEKAKYRNENNTGPVQRIYAVTVKDTTGAQLMEYGDLMPHSKYGNTKVYFFLPRKPAPKQLLPGEINFDTTYNANCFARYEKGGMGNVGLVKNPFK